MEAGHWGQATAALSQVGWLAGWVGGWVVGWFVGWVVRWVNCRFVGWVAGCLGGLLIGCFFWMVGARLAQSPNLSYSKTVLLRDRGLVWRQWAGTELSQV